MIKSPLWCWSLLVLLFPFDVLGADLKYPVKDIPEPLRLNARSVIRYSEEIFEIQSMDRATEKTTRVITVLNKNGLEDANFSEFYDKNSRISQISAVVYDGNGVKIKTIKSSEILDVSAISGYDLYTDYRCRLFDPGVRNTPFTIEYSFVKDYNGLLNYPGWVVPDYQVSVEQAVFKVITPKDFPLRYFQNGLSEPVKTTEKDLDGYTWTMVAIPAIKPEPFSQPPLEFFPAVYTATAEFGFEGTIGKSDSWMEFGKWIATLNQGKTVLPSETQLKLLELVKGESDVKKKAEMVYTFLQDRVRYVSIQGGIRSYQPFDATTVDRLAYGDCKALTNYMKALLEVVGVESVYTLAKAGGFEERVVTDFPSNQFNHVLLCIPYKSDTIWLECTSQQSPFGYLGTFTDDRDVLLIKPDGGQLVRTPAYSEQDNLKTQVARVHIEPDGYGKAEVENRYEGIYFGQMLAMASSDQEAKKKALYKSIAIPSFDILTFSYKVDKSTTPVVREKISLSLNNYATTMGTNLILPINLLNQNKEVPRKDEKRLSDVFIRRGWTEIDSIRYVLPEGYQLAGLPEPQKFSSLIGDYESMSSTTGNELLYVRKMVRRKGQFSKENFPQVIAFLEKVAVADGVKVALKKIP